MSRLLTYSQACTRFAPLATTGISIEDAVTEAVQRIYELGRYPGTIEEVSLAEADFIYDSELGHYHLYFDEATYDGAIGFRSNNRGWSIMDHTALYRDGVNAGDLEFLDMGTVDYVTAIGYASITIDPDGADNSFVVQANQSGSAGTDITFQIAAAGSATSISVDVTSTAILVTPIKASIVVAGAGSSSANGTYLYNGVINDKPSYKKSGATSYPLLYWSSGFWQLDITGNAVADYSSSSAVATPDLASGWTNPEGTLPVPTFTAVWSSAADIIAAVNSDPTASAMVTLTAEGTVTGQVAAVDATNLEIETASSSRRKYRSPLSFSPANGPYYALMKLEAPEMEASTIIHVESIAALKCAILAVCQEYVSDDERAMLNWQKFDQLMTRAERQYHGPKKFYIGFDSSLRRKPTQFL